MGSGQPGAYDRVAERRRAVALAHDYREAGGLSIAQIAERLGRTPATLKVYFYDHRALPKGLRIPGDLSLGLAVQDDR